MAANLAAAGRWQIAVNVRCACHDDVTGAFPVEVPDASGVAAVRAASGRDPWVFPEHGLSANQAFGSLLIFAGIVLYRCRGWPRAQGRTLAMAGRPIAVLAMVGGGTLFFAVHTHAGQGAAPALNNPAPGDERSLRAGGQLFADNCRQCHGQTGHGDGPRAPGLNPRPVDLTVHVGLHPDSQLYDWIVNGILGTAMPAWKDQLTETQRWVVVNYLRTLSAAEIDGVPVRRLAGRR